MLLLLSLLLSMTSQYKTLAEILDIISTDIRIIFISFKAKWCNPCKKIELFITELSNSELSEYVNFYSIDIDNSKDAVDYFDIESVPTFMVYLNGKKRGEIKGIDKKEITNLLEDVMKEHNQK